MLCWSALLSYCGPEEEEEGGTGRMSASTNSWGGGGELIGLIHSCVHVYRWMRQSMSIMLRSSTYVLHDLYLCMHVFMYVHVMLTVTTNKPAHTHTHTHTPPPPSVTLPIKGVGLKTVIREGRPGPRLKTLG